MANARCLRAVDFNKDRSIMSPSPLLVTADSSNHRSQNIVGAVQSICCRSKPLQSLNITNVVPPSREVHGRLGVKSSQTKFSKSSN